MPAGLEECMLLFTVLDAEWDLAFPGLTIECRRALMRLERDGGLSRTAVLESLRGPAHIRLLHVEALFERRLVVYSGGQIVLTGMGQAALRKFLLACATSLDRYFGERTPAPDPA